MARATLAIRSTRIGQLMERLAQRIGGNQQAPDTWEGIGMFTENLLRPQDPDRLQVYENFQDNLEDILKAGRKAGVPVLLSTVGSNLLDCAPFASLHDEGLPEKALSEWESLFEEGKALEETGSFEAALGLYTRAATIDPGYAELQFRIGRCLGLSGKWEEAWTALERARDNDALVVRADSRINEVITAAAGQDNNGDVVFVDAARLVGSGLPGGIPGQDLFYEHVHYTLRGNYQLARILADNLTRMLPPGLSKISQNAWAEPFAVQIKLAATFWDKHRLWTEMQERFSVAPFNARSSNADNLAYCASRAAAVGGRINSQIDRKMYAFALSTRPDDYFLRSHHGRYLENNGFLTEAIDELRWVCEIFPGFEGGHQELGIALFLAKRYPEAEASFERVLEINPHYTKARVALELIRNEQR
jgi:tetratricopeptide (TPR) repeat protein